MSIRVMLIDDHPVVRAGLRAVIETPEMITVVGEASSGAEALTLAEVLAPHVVLCDLRLGDGVDGITVTRELRSRPEGPAVLILTTFDNDSEIIAALDAGACGYLLKDIDPRLITEAIQAAARGESFFPPQVASKVFAHLRNPGPKLTRREREVMSLLATGASNSEIAREMFVAEATVKSHLVNIFTKLGVESRARAIRVAEDLGLV